ncbi:hypothetical protein PFICI_10144 [Pestalotiopsis fici W106-1]|uniref:Uncharacterized protein n=1 Tax=Pestalotiopsis fici (strain W106-1 / CGMCC3.15140) TaxID=1229662 RepID=W3WY57_PESFW|nr:uncharacterized protein PFICI_10144 [Pestalotiopsis fici W106-1]ETS78082.1 hypothetical protein PFICI_10144 [Pestalotiopsis fici W106-1]
MATTMEPMAIIGFSFRLPQDAQDEARFWEVMQNRENLAGEWPETRLNVGSLHDDDSPKRPSTLAARGGHFYKEDIAGFDAPFFSITANEAMAMDPQQRWALELAYLSFENAGLTMPKLKGSRMAIYASTISDDYSKILSKDPDDLPRMSATGLAPSTLPARISWYFDLQGPSFHLDTACSGSMVSLDLAFQSFRNGETDCALIMGSSMFLTPETSMMLGQMNFLSPDSRCYSFDHRANGYARGEGLIGLVVKPLSAAIRDGNTIRALVRSTGTNQDGRTPTLTQPSTEAQERLIRSVYKKANLDFTKTRYFEAHGTGTPTGDPIEMESIGKVFKSSRSKTEPLYVGTVKANIGHLEGGSGLAGILKSVMILERGIIPPNALFEKINPRIDPDALHIAVPTESIDWPTNDLRRISVNSFGIGGTNGHAVLDDACHYLHDHQLQGHHNCFRDRETPFRNGVDAHIGSTQATQNGGTQSHDHVNGHVNGHDTTLNSVSASEPPKLLVWTAFDEATIRQVTERYSEYLKGYIGSDKNLLSNLAHTLSERRDHLRWRSFAVADSGSNVSDSDAFRVAKPTRALSGSYGINFLFTGQGAQYAGMGMGLMKYAVFKKTLQDFDDALARLGCPWSLFGSIDKLQDGQSIDQPEYSQPLCTALQIALVELLKTFGITPTAVVGHSSGEIAAAFTAGALSFDSACQVAYHRGRLACKLRTATSDAPGAMLSANISPDQVSEYLDKADQETVHVACVNSPLNITLSGSALTIDKLKQSLDREGIFAQKVNTGIAYHSPAMQAIAEEYAEVLESIRPPVGESSCTGVPMASSVTGHIIPANLLSTPRYWVDNLVSQVKFSDAIQTASELLGAGRFGASNGGFLEIGPHAALRRPVNDTLRQSSSHVSDAENIIGYHSALYRSKPAVQSLMEMAGQLFSVGYPVIVSAVNQELESKPSMLTNCPSYPFNHSRKYWSESRLSKDFRLRGDSTWSVLGRRATDWNPLDPRWRNVLTLDSAPWLGDHVVNNNIVVPGTAMLVMSLQAVHQLATPERPLAGFLIKSARFSSPIMLANADSKTETMVQVHPVRKSYEKEVRSFDVKIYAYSNERWTECFEARVMLQYATDLSNLDGDSEQMIDHERVKEQCQETAAACTRKITPRAFYTFLNEYIGLKYGKTFQLLEDIRWDGKNSAVASVGTSTTEPLMAGDYPQPTVLDAAIHLCLAQLSRGLTLTGATLVPHEISNAWISATGWKCSSVQLLSEAAYRSDSTSAEMAVKILDSEGTPLCSVGQLKLAAVSKSGNSQSQEKVHLYKIASDAQLSMLSPEKLQALCLAPTAPEPQYLGYAKALGPALLFFANKAMSQLGPQDLVNAPPHMEKYLSSLKPLLAENKHEIMLTESDYFNVLEQYAGKTESWRLLPAVAQNLVPLIKGEVDVLELFFDDGMVEDYYASIFKELLDDRLRRFLRLVSHEKPALRILEVGAGTGAMTRGILDTLHQFEIEEGSMRFAEYVYTDISPGFFDHAKTKFQQFEDRISFQKFDLEKSAQSQGLVAGSFDLIIAGSVIHAVSELNTTLQHLRGLLNDNGRLVLLEIVSPQNPCVAVPWGLLPGWWLAKEKWRSTNPLITEVQWDHVLKEAGFTGTDLVLRDHEDPKHGICSIMISKADAQHSLSNGSTLQGTTQSSSTHLVVLFDEQSSLQAELAGKLVHSHGGRLLPFSKLGEAKIDSRDVVISLLEIDRPLLSIIQEEEFSGLKSVLTQAKDIMWATAVNPESPAYALYSCAKGFLRSLRSEAIEKHIVTLSIETSDPAANSAHYLEYIQESLRVSFEGERARDTEYIVRDGVFYTERLAQEIELENRTQSSGQLQPRIEPWSGGSPVKLDIPVPGLLDTLRFVEDTEYVNDLSPEDVEIEAKAWPLSFRDIFIALGRLEGETPGFECAGVVTRVGTNVTDFRPGDRVALASPGCIKTYPRAHMDYVQHIPDDASFEDAASGVNPAMTAYHALINQARLEEGEKILIHSAAGSTGQMAIWIAKSVGAEIFVTVGSDEKKQLLIDRFGIAADHIFYSRNTTFAGGIMRATDNRGVDVVLNSLSGDGLIASWDCVAPYGRFIEIGKADISENTPLPMSGFKKNVSFCAIDLHHMALTNRALVKKLFAKVTDLFSRNIMQKPYPRHVYTIWDIEEALRYMQSGKHIGRIIITADCEKSGTKLVRNSTSWTFDANASYVIAGGFGGLGRSMGLWLATRGAKNLVILSRSGTSSATSQSLVEELKELGSNVYAPRCDVSSSTDLANVIEECGRNMPPIKGVLNAAMVLQDAIVENMTHAQFRTAVQTKVQSSWNLHNLLPPNLDFFIMLSSLSGIYGSAAQSNYAAGCTYQDALAKYRIARGQKAVSFDVGWMRTIGIIAEKEDYRRTREVTRDMVPIEEKDFLALLEVYCDPSRTLQSLDKAQLLIGARTPAEYKERGFASSRRYAMPLFMGFEQSFGSTSGAASGGQRDMALMDDFSVLFQKATSAEEKSAIVVKGLAGMLARALMIPADDISQTRSLSDYGVDSLMAVELRNWISNKFDTNIGVFDIMGGKPIHAIGDLVVSRSIMDISG